MARSKLYTTEARRGPGRERQEPENKPESASAKEEKEPMPGGGKIVDRIEGGRPAGAAMRGGMKAEREAQHTAHERERLGMHGAHRDEHRAMHDRHEAEHAKAKPEDYPAMHRKHEHELLGMRHRHMEAHHEMMRRHHEEDQKMHAKHEMEMGAMPPGMAAPVPESQAA